MSATTLRGGPQTHKLLHGEGKDVRSDSAYRGVEKREEIQAQQPGLMWHIAMMPGKRKMLDKDTLMSAILEKLEQTKASIRAWWSTSFRSSSGSSVPSRLSIGG